MTPPLGQFQRSYLSVLGPLPHLPLFLQKIPTTVPNPSLKLLLTNDQLLPLHLSGYLHLSLPLSIMNCIWRLYPFSSTLFPWLLPSIQCFPAHRPSSGSFSVVSLPDLRPPGLSPQLYSLPTPNYGHPRAISQVCLWLISSISSLRQFCLGWAHPDTRL